MASLDENRNSLRWRKSGRSSSGNCVELAPLSGGVAMRNSRDPDGQVLVYSQADFSLFLNEIKAGGFDYLVR